MSVIYFRRSLVPLLFAAALAISGCSSSQDRAKAHFERGSEFAAQGDPIKASLEFRNALRLAGDYPDALFALGLAQEQQGNYADALRSFVTVAEQVPGHVQARVRLSIILLAGGQIDDAARYAEEAAALSANDPSVLVAQSAIALKRGDAQTAVKLAEAALAADPGFVDALMVLASERLLNSDPAGAVAFLERAPADSDTNVGLQMLRLTALDALDDQPAVEELFVKLVGLFPETNVFRDGLVNWYLERDRIDDAERVNRERVAANPADDEARLGLTRFLLAHRSPETAELDLEGAIAERAAANGDTYALRLALAELKLQAGKVAEAVALTQAVVADTSDVEKRNRARMHLARMLVAQQDPTQARTIVDAVLAEDARNVDALSVRASLKMLNGDIANAIEDLLAALNEAPNDGSLHGLLAEAYDRDGATLLAQEQYTKALELSGNAPQVGLPVARFFLRNGKPDQALRALELVRPNAPENREILGLLAQIKLANRDWLGAQQIADTLRQLGESTDNVAADRIGAAALIGLDRAAEGVSLLQSAIGSGESQQVVLPDLINAYVRSGKTEAARDYLNALLAGDPDDVQALTLLGWIYSLEGEEELVEATLKKAAAGEGLNGEVALAQYYLTTSNHAAAEATIKAGLAEDGDSNVLQRMLAALYEQTERFDDAISVYETMYEQDPSAINLANDLASLLSERRNDPASLERAFEIAQRLRGSDVPQYLDTLGWIYYLRGEYDEALPLLRSAAAKLPNIPLIHYHLGMAYHALGQRDLARTSLQRALEITPPLLATDLEKAKAALAGLDDAEPAAGAQQS